MTKPTAEPEAPPSAWDQVDQVPLQEAIRRAMHDIGAIGRGGQMEHGEKYKYRKLDDLIAAAQPVLIRHGIVVYPIATSAVYEVKTNRQGNPMQWVSLRVSWGVVGPMGDTLPEPMATVGEANDSSDKATNKAHSAAQKVAIAQLFQIPYSSDDQDAGRQEMGNARQEPTAEDLWDAANDEERANRSGQQQRLDQLPAEAAEKILAKVSEKAGIPVTGVADLGPSWLPYWIGILDAAWAKVEKDGTR